MTTTVTDNPDRARYEIREGDQLAGFAEYHLHGEVIAFLHTEIAEKFEGRGLASNLIRESLDDARRRHLTVQPFCPFVRSFIGKNAGYRDLVREAEWERFGLH